MSPNLNSISNNNDIGDLGEMLTKNLQHCVSRKHKKKNRGKLLLVALIPLWQCGYILGVILCISLSCLRALKRGSQLRNVHQHYFTCFLTSPAAYRAACLLLIYIKKKKSMCIVE